MDCITLPVQSVDTEIELLSLLINTQVLLIKTFLSLLCHKGMDIFSGD